MHLAHARACGQLNHVDDECGDPDEAGEGVDCFRWVARPTCSVGSRSDKM